MNFESEIKKKENYLATVAVKYAYDKTPTKRNKFLRVLNNSQLVMPILSLFTKEEIEKFPKTEKGEVIFPEGSVPYRPYMAQNSSGTVSMAVFSGEDEITKGLFRSDEITNDINSGKAFLISGSLDYCTRMLKNNPPADSLILNFQAIVTKEMLEEAIKMPYETFDYNEYDKLVVDESKKSHKIEYNVNNNIDFLSIEKKLEFVIRPDLKEFLNRNIIDKSEYKFDSSHFGHAFDPKYSKWFTDTDDIKFNFYPITFLPDIDYHIINNFHPSNYYYDTSVCGDVYEEGLPKMFLLGSFDTTIGSTPVYFNNNTGNIEWLDSTYGTGKWSSDPRGIVSNNIKEFLGFLVPIIPKK